MSRMSLILLLGSQGHLERGKKMPVLWREFVWHSGYLFPRMPGEVSERWVKLLKWEWFRGFTLYILTLLEIWRDNEREKGCSLIIPRSFMFAFIPISSNVFQHKDVFNTMIILLSVFGFIVITKESFTVLLLSMNSYIILSFEDK